MKYPANESSTLEFKLSIPKNEQIIKTVIGFCNQNGGKIIIGVNNDQTIVGVDEQTAQQTMEYVDKSIFEATTPHIIPRVYLQRIGEKTILIIEVSAGMNKPYFLTSEGLERGTYIRLGRNTLRATMDIIQELQWQARGRSYDAMPLYATQCSSLDHKKIDAFFHAKGTDRKTGTASDTIRAYHVIAQEHGIDYPTVAGMLLFGKNPQQFLSEAFIICSSFRGITGREAIATKDCTGTLTEQFNQAYNFIVTNLNKAFSITGPRRKEVLEIPEVAIRELLINAIIHRNYHLPAPTKIAIYDNRVEIFSPGGFPGPLDTNNLLQGLSYIRNTIIFKIFREMGYIEKLGSGFIAAFQNYAKRGLPKPEVVEGENYIKCILPRMSNLRKQPQRSLQGIHQQPELEDILHLFRTSTEIAVGDVINNLRIPRATATRRLAQLVQLNVLRSVGRGKATRYVLVKT